jgi:hydrogenase maturation protein HypF
MTSSAGRLFDAVSAMLGIAPVKIDHEGEAAMLLEAAAQNGVTESYGFDISGGEVDFRKMIRQIAEDRSGAGKVAAKFHNTLVNVVLSVAGRAAKEQGARRVFLGGGVFLNSILLNGVIKGLEKMGLEVYAPERFSPGDECISTGQAYYAALRTRGDI